MNEKISDFMLMLYLRAVTTLSNEDGVATVEILLILAVLVALGLMFKDTIVSFVSDLLDNISGQGAAFDPSTIVP